MGTALVKFLIEQGAGDRFFLYATDPVRKPERLCEPYQPCVFIPWSSPENLMKAVRPDCVIFAGPYPEQELYLHMAMRYASHCLTLGQMTDMLKRFIETNPAEGTGSVLIPDCGLAPGLLNCLAADFALSGEYTSVTIECGGLPMDPYKGGVLHYGLSFHPAGLLQEYQDIAWIKENGEVKSLYPLQNKEPGRKRNIREFELPLSSLPVEESPWYHLVDEKTVRVQNLEARMTADGTSVMPWDKRFSRVDDITYWTIRYAGHYEWFEQAYEKGAFEEPEFLEALERLPEAIPDIVFFRVSAKGAEKTRDYEGAFCADALLQAFPTLAMSSLPVYSAMQISTCFPAALTALALLGFEPSCVRENHITWHGKPVEEILTNGGCVPMYDVIHGGRVLEWMGATDHIIFTRTYEE